MDFGGNTTIQSIARADLEMSIALKNDGYTC